MIWKIVVIAIFAFEILKLEKTLWSWFSHSKSLIWKIIIIVTFVSNFVSFDSYSICNKNLKIIFVNDSKKTWFDDFIVCCFQYRKFDFVQFIIFDLMIDNWLNDKKIEFEFFFIFLFFYFLHQNRWIVRKKWLNAKDVE